MSPDPFKEVDLLRHARLLRRAAGRPLPVALCDAQGQALWLPEDPDGAGLGPLLGELAREAALAEGCAAARLQLGPDRSLAFAPVTAAGGAPLGYLAALVDASGAGPAPAGVEEALRDVAGGIAREVQLRIEVEGLSAEVAARYDELNLVYMLEGQARALDQGAVGARELLRDFADCLGVDLAVLVLPERRPIHALRHKGAIPNLDLVLTELTAHLMPFLAVSKTPLVLNEFEDVRREYLFSNLPYRLLACPVSNGGQIEGMMALLRTQDGPFFTNSDRNLAMVIAGQTSLVLRNQRMVTDLKRFGDQLVEALIRAVEAKDPYTRGHSERVQGVASRIAQAADLSSTDVEAVSWGALLHDVGKIGIPDRILCKAGRLTEEEYTLVKIHPERSYDILRHIEHLDARALDAARYHQEKYDGSGYPHGLRGLQIPLHARLTAVADTYDAITSSRAYRAGASHDDAMQRIAEAAGRQLDPHFVQVLEKLCEHDTDWLEALKSSDALEG